MQSPSPSSSSPKRQRTTTIMIPEEQSFTTQQFTVADIIQSPLPGYTAPSSLSFSPNDNSILYLYSENSNLNRNVYAFDIETTKKELVFSPPNGDEGELSVEEKLRRERARELGLGVIKYEWVKEGVDFNKMKIMVPLPSGIYIQDLSCPQPELKLPNTPSLPIIEPRVSPDGTMLAYVRNYELHVLNLSEGEPKQITFGATAKYLTHGIAEYIAQEEMDRKHGFWWSPDSKYIAFTEVDTCHIPPFTIVHQGKNSVGSDAQEDHAYPFTGTSNAKVKLGVISSSGGPVTWMELLCGEQNSPSSDDEYLGRVNWMPGNVLTAQILNRSQTKLKIIKFNVETGERKTLFLEENNIWVNLHDCFTPLDNKEGKFSGGFIWASEKTGYRHLYIHDKDGTCLGPITEGEWMVEQVAGVSEATGIVYFTGTLDSPIECNLYCTSLFPDWSHGLQTPRRLTQSKGKHTVVLDHQLQKFIDTYESINSPPTVSLRSLHDGSLITILYDYQPNSLPILKKLPLFSPEIVEIPASAADGTILYGALYRPNAEIFGPPPYKTCINVYGGPCFQLVSDSWRSTVDLRAQYLRSKGILVWKLDNRGTARRGLKFESSLKHNFGKIDAEDQNSGAEWLIKQGLAKPGHIGIYGWSYGGYLSAMTLARFPDTFQLSISGAPPTSWDGYDTFYTEKYMGFPWEHTEEYEHGSVMRHVSNIKGKFLLIHGMLDENVHFRHTARLLNALVAAGKMYELLVFPDERHYPRPRKNLIYLEERMMEFIHRNL
ncbi:dipeptidyl-peptidase IV [Ranunculus cassubicifolius]